MTAKFFWFYPRMADSCSIVGLSVSHTATHQIDPHRLPRAPSRRYLAEVARAADRLATKAGCFAPYRRTFWREDAWLTAPAPLADTERLKFLAERFRPGLPVLPTLV